MMNREQIFAEVRSTMVELFELDGDAITLETGVFTDLDLDSIDAIDLVARLQQLTGKRVTEEEMRRVRTITDIVDLVQNQLEGLDKTRDKADAST